MVINLSYEYTQMLSFVRPSVKSLGLRGVILGSPDTQRFRNYGRNTEELSDFLIKGGIPPVSHSPSFLPPSQDMHIELPSCLSPRWHVGRNTLLEVTVLVLRS